METRITKYVTADEASDKFDTVALALDKIQTMLKDLDKRMSAVENQRRVPKRKSDHENLNME